MDTSHTERSAVPKGPDSVFFGPYRFERDGLLLSLDGAPLSVPPKALLVLRCLVDRPGKVVPKKELIDLVWGDTAVTDNSLTEAIRVLRRAIGDDPRAPTYIETAHRRGYRFIAEVTADNGNEEQDPAGPTISGQSVDADPVHAAEPAASAPVHTRASRIEEGSPSRVGAGAVDVRRGNARRRNTLAIAILAAIPVLAGLALWQFRTEGAANSSRAVNLQFGPEPAEQIQLLSRRTPVAISPDGSQIAFIGQEDGVSRIYTRPLEQLLAKVLPGTEGGWSPFFSPDGRWIAYFNQPTQTLNKVSVAGGAPVVLTDVRHYMGGTWGPNGTLVFAMREGLWSIDVNGDNLTELVAADFTAGERGFDHPDFLPGGEAVLFAVVTADDISLDDADIAILFLETGEYEILLRGGTAPRYANSGHIVYALDGSLMAVEFDLASYQITSAPFEAVRGVATYREDGFPQFALSDNGVLVYVPGGAMPSRQLIWVDRQGRGRPMSERRDGFIVPSVSPDGRRLAVTRGWSNHALWIYDVERDDFTRLTHGWDDHLAVWTHGGSRIAFQSDRAQTPNIFSVQVDGAGEVTPLWLSEHVLIPTSWSSATATLAFVEIHPKSGRDIWLLPTEGTATAEPFIRTEFNEDQGVFSPDGRFIAYSSDESGQSQIYVQSVFPPARRWAISRDGGSAPRWSADGNELFFWNLDTGLMALAVDAEFAGEPELLFDGTPLRLGAPWAYNVHPNGDFVINSMDQPTETLRVNVILNWFEGLKERAPAGGT